MDQFDHILNWKLKQGSHTLEPPPCHGTPPMRTSEEKIIFLVPTNDYEVSTCRHLFDF